MLLPSPATQSRPFGLSRAWFEQCLLETCTWFLRSRLGKNASCSLVFYSDGALRIHAKKHASGRELERIINRCYHEIGASGHGGAAAFGKFMDDSVAPVLEEIVKELSPSYARAIAARFSCPKCFRALDYVRVEDGRIAVAFVVGNPPEYQYCQKCDLWFDMNGERAPKPELVGDDSNKDQ